MEGFGFFLMALAITPVIAAAALAIYFLYPAQRSRPSVALTILSALPALSALVIVALMGSLFGKDGLSPLIIILAVVTLALSAPVLRRRRQTARTSGA